MKFALVGIGSAGGRIVDELHRQESTSERSFTRENLLVFDTQRSAFERYSNVPLDRHVLVGDTHPQIRGEGLDGDLELGASIARQEVDEIHREFDKLDLHRLDAVVVVAGLGGGTGGGVGAVILENLVSLTDNPVFAVGVLPHSTEPDTVAVNAARSLQSFVKHADNVVLLDNDAWYAADRDQPLEESYPRLNTALARRLGMSLATGELESGVVAESMVDTSDLIKTLSTGGVSAIGHASLDLGDEGLLDKLLSLFRNGTDEDTKTDAMQTLDLIQEAASSQLTLPCSIESADRLLLVLSGPPEEISRKGFERGRHWLEQESDTVEMFAGDEPRPDASTVSAAVLFSNVTDVPRIDRLQKRATAVTAGSDSAGETAQRPGHGEQRRAPDRGSDPDTVARETGTYQSEERHQSGGGQSDRRRTTGGGSDPRRSERDHSGTGRGNERRGE